MTDKILFLIIGVAFFHFIYRTLVLMILQMILHYKMLALRNYLGDIKQSSGDGAFRLVAINLEWAIETFRDFTLVKLYVRDRLSTPNENLINLIERRNREIDEADPRLREIVDVLDRYLMNALFINSFGLLLWLSPAVIVIFIRNRFMKLWPDKIRRAVRSFVFVPTQPLLK
jgi:hypothetical protein